MAKSLQDFQIESQNGEAVSPDDLSDFLDTHEFLTVPLERKGKTVNFTVEIDGSQVSAQDVGSYRKAVAQLAVDALEAKEHVEAKVEDAGKDESSEEAQIDVADMVRALELQEAYAKNEAQLLAKLIVASNYPSKDLSDPAVLTERTGIGPAARKVLHDYFFGSSTEPEEETGTSETAPIPAPSATSEQTATSDNSPAIS